MREALLSTSFPPVAH